MYKNLRLRITRHLKEEVNGSSTNEEAGSIKASKVIDTLVAGSNESLKHNRFQLLYLDKLNELDHGAFIARRKRPPGEEKHFILLALEEPVDAKGKVKYDMSKTCDLKRGEAEELIDECWKLGGSVQWFVGNSAFSGKETDSHLLKTPEYGTGVSGRKSRKLEEASRNLRKALKLLGELQATREQVPEGVVEGLVLTNLEEEWEDEKNTVTLFNNPNDPEYFTVYVPANADEDLEREVGNVLSRKKSAEVVAYYLDKGWEVKWKTFKLSQTTRVGKTSQYDKGVGSRKAGKLEEGSGQARKLLRILKAGGQEAYDNGEEQQLVFEHPEGGIIVVYNSDTESGNFSFHTWGDKQVHDYKEVPFLDHDKFKILTPERAEKAIAHLLKEGWKAVWECVTNLGVSYRDEKPKYGGGVEGRRTRKLDEGTASKARKLLDTLVASEEDAKAAGEQRQQKLQLKEPDGKNFIVVKNDNGSEFWITTGHRVSRFTVPDLKTQKETRSETLKKIEICLNRGWKARWFLGTEASPETEPKYGKGVEKRKSRKLEESKDSRTQAKHILQTLMRANAEAEEEMQFQDLMLMHPVDTQEGLAVMDHSSHHDNFFVKPLGDPLKDAPVVGKTWGEPVSGKQLEQLIRGCIEAGWSVRWCVGNLGSSKDKDVGVMKKPKYGGGVKSRRSGQLEEGKASSLLDQLEHAEQVIVERRNNPPLTKDGIPIRGVRLKLTDPSGKEPSVLIDRHKSRVFGSTHSAWYLSRSKVEKRPPLKDTSREELEELISKHSSWKVTWIIYARKTSYHKWTRIEQSQFPFAAKTRKARELDESIKEADKLLGILVAGQSEAREAGVREDQHLHFSRPEGDDFYIVVSNTRSFVGEEFWVRTGGDGQFERGLPGIDSWGVHQMTWVGTHKVVEYCLRQEWELTWVCVDLRSGKHTHSERKPKYGSGIKSRKGGKLEESSKARVKQLLRNLWLGNRDGVEYNGKPIRALTLFLISPETDYHFTNFHYSQVSGSLIASVNEPHVDHKTLMGSEAEAELERVVNEGWRERWSIHYIDESIKLFDEFPLKTKTRKQRKLEESDTRARRLVKNLLSTYGVDLRYEGEKVTGLMLHVYNPPISTEQARDLVTVYLDRSKDGDPEIQAKSYVDGVLTYKAKGEKAATNLVSEFLEKGYKVRWHIRMGSAVTLSHEEFPFKVDTRKQRKLEESDSKAGRLLNILGAGALEADKAGEEEYLVLEHPDGWGIDIKNVHSMLREAFVAYPYGENINRDEIPLIGDYSPLVINSFKKGEEIVESLLNKGWTVSWEVTDLSTGKVTRSEKTPKYGRGVISRKSKKLDESSDRKNVRLNEGINNAKKLLRILRRGWEEISEKGYRYYVSLWNPEFPNYGLEIGVSAIMERPYILKIRKLPRITPTRTVPASREKDHKAFTDTPFADQHYGYNDGPPEQFEKIIQTLLDKGWTQQWVVRQKDDDDFQVSDKPTYGLTNTRKHRELDERKSKASEILRIVYDGWAETKKLGDIFQDAVLKHPRNPKYGIQINAHGTAIVAKKQGSVWGQVWWMELKETDPNLYEEFKEVLNAKYSDRIIAECLSKGWKLIWVVVDHRGPKKIVKEYNKPRFGAGVITRKSSSLEESRKEVQRVNTILIRGNEELEAMDDHRRQSVYFFYPENEKFGIHFGAKSYFQFFEQRGGIKVALPERDIRKKCPSIIMDLVSDDVDIESKDALLEFCIEKGWRREWTVFDYKSKYDSVSDKPQYGVSKTRKHGKLDESAVKKLLNVVRKGAEEVENKYGEERTQLLRLISPEDPEFGVEVFWSDEEIGCVAEVVRKTEGGWRYSRTKTPEPMESEFEKLRLYDEFETHRALNAENVVDCCLENNWKKEWVLVNSFGVRKEFKVSPHPMYGVTKARKHKELDESYKSEAKRILQILERGVDETDDTPFEQILNIMRYDNPNSIITLEYALEFQDKFAFQVSGDMDDTVRKVVPAAAGMVERPDAERIVTHCLKSKDWEVLWKICEIGKYSRIQDKPQFGAEGLGRRHDRLEESTIGDSEIIKEILKRGQIEIMDNKDYTTLQQFIEFTCPEVDYVSVQFFYFPFTEEFSFKTSLDKPGNPMWLKKLKAEYPELERGLVTLIINARSFAKSTHDFIEYCVKNGWKERWGMRKAPKGATRSKVTYMNGPRYGVTKTRKGKTINENEKPTKGSAFQKLRKTEWKLNQSPT